MKIMGFARAVIGAWGALGMLAGCSAGSQLGLAPTAQRAVALPSRADRARSWMAPDLNLKKKDLLYVSDFDGSDVLVFTYPGGKLTGTLTGITDAQGECASSTSKGNWWVVASGADEILEYAHGGTSAISTLSETAGEPSGCAVDPTTGNLAVTILSNGDVVIFPGAKGGGTVMSSPLTEAFFDAYDSKGDLFIDGLTASDAYVLLELPKRSSEFGFKTITLNETIEVGGLQWYGRYLVIGSSNGLDRFRIHGTTGTLEGTTPLEGASDVVTFWIQKPDVVGADAGNADAAIWRYPAGGMPIKIITGNFALPIGVVVSLATK